MNRLSFLQGCLYEQEAQEAQDAHLPQRPTKAMLAAAGLFESYERQILTVEGAIKVGGSGPRCPTPPGSHERPSSFMAIL